ncbi:PTS sugar transporter subunit IIA [Collinsella sp. zg1085]|uniref:PTS sugar transporter subunit IIA n=1 Tax=Collinsella sp. zg1085 TaxID=2844380 RepID=UPI001C0D47EE|nr:PTS sugar transporter subunit IIA [Collinsella sp. zg1085]QWT17293.1 PTS sugar transporter subunit IIA [Collinsella sp. zg1085]
MKGIVIASHGMLAEGMLHAVKMFSDDPEYILACGLMPEEDLVGYTAKLEAAAAKVNTGEGVVIFCDLLYGSPCNCAALLQKRGIVAGGLDVVAGVNLAMLLEFVSMRSSGIALADILKAGHAGIQDYAEL